MVACIAILAVLILSLWDVGIFKGYLTVSEVKQGNYLGKIIEVKGRVKKDTLEINTTGAYFNLTDYINEIAVEYNGDLPVRLAVDKEVIVTGALISREKILASKIVTSCTSKYIS
jgi:cytochrome c-type biogenesis protein CcmE